jgi:hypothetical protein
VNTDEQCPATHTHYTCTLLAGHQDTEDPDDWAPHQHPDGTDWDTTTSHTRGHTLRLTHGNTATVIQGTFTITDEALITTPPRTDVGNGITHYGCSTLGPLHLTIDTTTELPTTTGIITLELWADLVGTDTQWFHAIYGNITSPTFVSITIDNDHTYYTYQATARPDHEGTHLHMQVTPDAPAVP